MAVANVVLDQVTGCVKDTMFNLSGNRIEIRSSDGTEYKSDLKSDAQPGLGVRIPS